MYNLSTVISFEIIRSLKKKSFWIMTFSFPLVIAAIFAIIFFSNQTTSDAVANTNRQSFTIAVTDESKLVAPALLESLHATVLSTKEEGVSAVEKGTYDAYFYYPANLRSESIETYGKDVGIFDNSRYQAVAESLVEQSVAATVSADATAVLQKNITVTATTYRDGKPYDAFQQMIAPGLFLVLFYILIVTFGNQMLTSTTEEKENRIIEMLLTTVQARTLITGKILSLMVLALIQIVLIALPIALIYMLFHTQLSLPSVDLSHIPFDPARIGIAAALFVGGFALFTGLLVAIGAAMPTAKEASAFFGVVMVLLFAPLYAAPLFISMPDSPMVIALSLFPFTAPIPLLLRNAVGNLSTPEALLAIVILIITATIVMYVAVRMFKYGALEYSRRLSLKTIFASRAKSSR